MPFSNTIISNKFFSVHSTFQKSKFMGEKATQLDKSMQSPILSPSKLIKIIKLTLKSKSGESKRCKALEHDL